MPSFSRRVLCQHSELNMVKALAFLFCVAAFAALCCCAPLTTLAQSSSSSRPPSSGQTSRLYAAPELSGSSPFLPSDLQNVELPVALGGFSAVALRDHQQWLPGSQQNQLVFDGQIYWFAGERDRQIFAAAPQQYAPVLGGDCVVTHVNTGKRTIGKLEYGLIHARRLYFFAGSGEREQFQSDRSRYANGDLAHTGKCLVSQVDQGRDVTGLPETVAVVNGLRYHFAGAYQRGLFAANMAHYGVRRELLHAKGDQPVHSLRPKVANAHSKNPQEKAEQQEEAKPLPKKAEEEADDHHYVMEGYCPVSIQEQGMWVRGSYQYLEEYEGRKYLLAGEKEKQLFLEDTLRYVPALGGDCIVSLTDDGKLVPGSVYHTLIFEGKLYLFAGPDQEQAFHAELTNYVEPAAETEEAPQESETPTDEEVLSEQQNGQ